MRMILRPLRWARSAWTLSVLNLLCVVGLCTVAAFMLWDMRWDAERRATVSARNLVQVLGRDINRSIATYDLSLRAIVDGMRLPAVMNAEPETRNLILFDRATNAENFGHTLILDHAGRLIISSKTLTPEPLSYADREYFQYHASHTDPGLHISPPLISRISGHWMLVISRRLSNPDGSFAGVVLGSIYLDYFRQLFAAIETDHSGTVTLYGPGGTVVMREPYDEQLIGRSVPATDSFQRMLQIRQGGFTGPAMTGEGTRTFTVTQVGEFPLWLSIALTSEDIYAAWWQKAFLLGTVFLSLCATTVVLTALFQRELIRRKAAQQATAALNAELRQFATTDALTGLANRRRFDEVLARECRRAARVGKPLSLLMLDADHFKSFNDRYGHQQGDEALRLIARAMQAALHAPSDTAYRIGGEEFAVVLPDTEQAGAETVANRLRRAVLEQLMPHAGNPHGLVTISCGVAVMSVGSNDDAAALIAAADSALYEAKQDRAQRWPAVSWPGLVLRSVTRLPEVFGQLGQQARFGAKVWGFLRLGRLRTLERQPPQGTYPITIKLDRQPRQWRRIRPKAACLRLFPDVLLRVSSVASAGGRNVWTESLSILRRYRAC